MAIDPRGQLVSFTFVSIFTIGARGSTMVAAVVLPVWLAVTELPEQQPLFIYCAIMALFIVFWHSSNIKRMRDGTEHRNDKLMIFRRKEKANNDDAP